MPINSGLKVSRIAEYNRLLQWEIKYSGLGIVAGYAAMTADGMLVLICANAEIKQLFPLL